MSETSVDDLPKFIRPFVGHGVHFDSIGEEEATGECPLCRKEGKFGVKVATGEYNCFVCGAKGNIYTFLRQLWDASDKATQDYKPIQRSRRLLFEETAMMWGACQSVLLPGTWMLPGYSPEGKLTQLYRYVRDPRTKKSLLLATAEVGHGLHGVNLFDRGRGTVYICEGPWDAMALWELLRIARRDGRDMEFTASEARSLLADACVLAVPGVQVFHPSWASLLAGKRVVLCYDSDHPREANGKTFRAGYDGLRRVVGVLASAEQPPAEVQYLCWGEDGYDPTLPSGYDVRDALTAPGDGGSPPDRTERLERLNALLDRLRPIPQDWVAGRKKSSPAGGVEIDCRPCKDWRTLINAWKKSGMVWTEGLDRALSVMLAATLSTGSVGSQLWVKIMSPPSTGKTTLCEAISVNRKHVKALSTIRGFHSGYREGDGSDNKSLILRVKNKTLVTKDGDTLLTAPNRDQVLSEARDLYDKVARSDYRTGMGMDHTGVNMTWILCGTSSLRQLDSADLGARFLDCVIMESIDDDLEDDICWRAANKMVRSIAIRSDSSQEAASIDAPMAAAMSLTGGYVDYLMDNAEKLLSEVQIDPDTLRKIVEYGKLVAFMRARPTTKHAEGDDREMAARLVEQHTRLAMCLAVVLSRKTVDEEVMRRVRITALDTARGLTFKMTAMAAASGEIGVTVSNLSGGTHQTDDQCRKLLRFLRKQGVFESFSPKDENDKTIVGGKVRWKLTPKFLRLYKSVVGNEENPHA